MSSCEPGQPGVPVQGVRPALSDQPLGEAERPRRESVSAVPLRQWPEVVKTILRRCGKDRITTAAASLAFHWFLALFPAILALLGAASLAGLSGHRLHSLVHALGILLPRAASSVLSSALSSPLSHGDSIIAVAAGTLVAIWSSVEAMAALQVGLDVAYDVTGDRGLVRRRVVALPMLALTVGLGGIAFALLVLGRPLGDLLAGYLPVATRGAFLVGWRIGRWACSIGIVVMLLSAYYTIAPDRRWRWEWLSPGALVATLGWVAVSAAYSFYLDDLGHASRTYGNLAGVAVLLIWLFLTGVVVLLGAELNRELERLAKQSAVSGSAAQHDQSSSPERGIGREAHGLGRCGSQ